MPFPYTFTFEFDPSPTVGPIRLTFIEKFTDPELENRLWYSHSPPSTPFAAYAWLEPVPMNILGNYGLALTKAGSYAWLTSANQVFRALATDEALDITEKIVRFDMRQ